MTATGRSHADAAHRYSDETPILVSRSWSLHLERGWEANKLVTDLAPRVAAGLNFLDVSADASEGFTIHPLVKAWTVEAMEPPTVKVQSRNGGALNLDEPYLDALTRYLATDETIRSKLNKLAREAPSYDATHSISGHYAERMAALKLIYSAPPRKSHKRLPGNIPVENATHFGLTVRSGTKYGLRIDRGTYARINKRSSTHFPRELAPKLWDASAKYYEDVDHRIHTDQWCTAYQARALENYDLNMAYFAALDRSEFNQTIDAAVAAQKGMVEVTDLNEWEGKTGLYVMVLDDYRQGYVGVTESLGGVKARVRKHWSSSKQFDRLLFGTVTQSILAMDSFRALDTTRIFAAKVRNPHELENKVIESLPGKFLLNRIMGGRGDLLGFVSALGVNILKTHDLEPRPTDTQPTD